MFCVACGKPIENNWKFCPHCGAKTPDLQPVAPVVTPTASAAPVSCAAEPEEERVSKRWIRGKEYRIPDAYKKNTQWDKMDQWVGEHSELKECTANGKSLPGFYNRCFTILEDDTLIGFMYGHCKRYENCPSFKYNLYRVDPDGTAIFLNAGSEGGIEQMVVKDGYAYWTWDQAYKVKID